MSTAVAARLKKKQEAKARSEAAFRRTLEHLHHDGRMFQHAAEMELAHHRALPHLPGAPSFPQKGFTPSQARVHVFMDKLRTQAADVGSEMHRRADVEAERDGTPSRPQVPADTPADGLCATTPDHVSKPRVADDPSAHKVFEEHKADDRIGPDDGPHPPTSSPNSSRALSKDGLDLDGVELDTTETASTPLTIRTKAVASRCATLGICAPLVCVGNRCFLPLLSTLPSQKQVQGFYTRSNVQLLVAGLIFINFVVNAADAQVNTEGDHQGVFDWFEYIFTVIFSIELAINMYANLWMGFWGDSWNVFDFIVVVVSVMSLLLSGIPGVTVLRLLRAFRVFRLFKRLESLRKIIICIEEAIPGVANAFGILVLVMSIFAILGVEFFRDVDFGGTLYFGTFAQAMLTLFQIMTGDSWAEAIARPCIEAFPFAAAYFIMYILVSTIVLANIAIAVLLEKFVGAGEEEGDDDMYDFGLSMPQQAVLPQLGANDSPGGLEYAEPPEALTEQSKGVLFEHLFDSTAPEEPGAEDAAALNESPELIRSQTSRKDGTMKPAKHPEAKSAKGKAGVMDQRRLRSIDNVLTQIVEELKKVNDKMGMVESTQRIVLEVLEDTHLKNLESPTALEVSQAIATLNPNESVL